METIAEEQIEKGLSLTKEKHIHNYIEDGNYMKCSICDKKVLKLSDEEHSDLRIGIKKDGKRYTVRKDRRRYFFPDEWERFVKLLTKPTHKFFFLTLVHTGGRIMEVLNLKYSNINLERKTIEFKVVKHKATKRAIHSDGIVRSFFIAENFVKEYKSFVRGRTIDKNKYIFLDNDKLPTDYDKLSNSQKSKYYNSKKVAYSGLLKRKVKKLAQLYEDLDIKNGGKRDWDWYNFSPHNIRKTYGMWMRTFNIENSELCYRLGHDMDTYMAHYGSSLIFTQDERRKIMKLFGDVK